MTRTLCWSTRSRVIGLLALTAALSIGAMGGAGVGRNQEAIKGESKQMGHYIRVFWGRLEQERVREYGVKPMLKDTQAIIGSPPGPYGVPLAARSGCEPRETAGLSMSYVPGHRYLVFVVAREKKADGFGRPGEEIVRIVDLDQTKQDAAALSLFQRPADLVCLPGHAAGEVTTEALDAWYATVQKQAAQGVLTAADVAAVLGEPRIVEVIETDDGPSRVKAEYIIAEPSLVKVTEESVDETTTECPRMTFLAEGPKIVAVQRDVYRESRLRLPEGGPVPGLFRE